MQRRFWKRYAAGTAHVGYYTVKPVPCSSTSRQSLIPFHSISEGQYSRRLWSPPHWIWRRAFGIHWLPSGRQSVSFSCGRACGRWCMQSESTTESVETCQRMASVLFTSLRKQSQGISISDFISGRITVVSMLMDFIIPWLMTRAVIYHRHWSWSPAPRCAMLCGSGKEERCSSECFQVEAEHGRTWSYELLQLPEWQW